MKCLLLVCVFGTALALQQYPAAYLVGNLWQFLPGRPHMLTAVFPSLNLKNRMLRCYYLKHDVDTWMLLDYGGELTEAPSTVRTRESLGVVIEAFDVNTTKLSAYHQKLTEHLFWSLKYQRKPLRAYMILVTRIQ